MNNFDFFSVRGTAVYKVSFATFVTQCLSPTGNRGHCVTRPNNGCEEDSVSVTLMHFIFAQKYLDNRDKRLQNTCASLHKLCFVSFSLSELM